MNNVTRDDADGMDHQHHEWSRGIRAETSADVRRMLCGVFAAVAGILTEFARGKAAAARESACQDVAEPVGFAHDELHQNSQLEPAETT